MVWEVKSLWLLLATTLIKLLAILDLIPHLWSNTTTNLSDNWEITLNHSRDSTSHAHMLLSMLSWRIWYFVPNGETFSSIIWSRLRVDIPGISIWTRFIKIYQDWVHLTWVHGQNQLDCIQVDLSSSSLNTHAMSIWIPILFLCIQFVLDCKGSIKIFLQFKVMIVLKVLIKW